MPEPSKPFNFLDEEWIEPESFESWEELVQYMQVEDIIEYDYRNARMPPDPSVYLEAQDEEAASHHGLAEYRSDHGIAMALLRSSNVRFINR